MAEKRHFTGNGTEDAPASKKTWFHGLAQVLLDTRHHVMSDNRVIVIRDKYPKAKHHYLVIAREDMPHLTKLSAADAPLISHMLATARKFTQTHCSNVNVRYGFHSVPSLSHLHLHIISQDFDSPCLKTKKHWNSFTTPFFLEAQTLIDDLISEDRALVDEEMCKEWMSQGLACHLCSAPQKTMPALKKHIRACRGGKSPSPAPSEDEDDRESSCSNSANSKSK